jgi:hypothetical protein
MPLFSMEIMEKTREQSMKNEKKNKRPIVCFWTIK